ncbi:TBC1 domain family member 24-like [Denticeps clupeoides]|uniref:TBC1 domain family member 24 n=2 Tax=Denticeps clupeoides TaxID=299321 RepID=A0AAY4ABF6_9TELE|nr:TBC1 domain family member 24-like [Denticeps clupeoides]
MIRVSSNPDFASFGTLSGEILRTDERNHADPPLLEACRQRSHSLYNVQDAKKFPEQSCHVRPRSRSFYSFETSEDFTDETFSRFNALKPRARSLLQNDMGLKNKSGDGAMNRPPSKRPKANSARNRNQEMSGNWGKSVPMMTISESDSWEISSCSGMKYGQYVEWEKIDPEAAVRYAKILASGHNDLKLMGRSGFWATPHTLRAKAYYHIISGISSNSNMTSHDVYHILTNQLFGEQKISTHPFPEFMEDGEIPRYCLNKAGLNSVKKILLSISKHLPDVSFCPILPALVSLLLHFSEDETQCFNSICCLVNYKDPNKRYIDQTFHTYRASCMTFGDLANIYCRGIRKLIASSHQNLVEFYSDWIMWIFADLPFPYAIRVLDLYLLEGYKVLYRVALALLSLYKTSVASRVARVDDFRQDMKSFVLNVTRHSTVENLLNKAFEIQLPTRQELNYLFSANKDALLQRGIYQKTHLYQTMDLSTFSSGVVTETEMNVVWAWIPERFALFSPRKLFSTNQHGRSLNMFYSHVDGHEPTVLLLKTADEEVCGAFLSSDWSGRKSHVSDGLMFFGTGECFVFTLRPGMERYQRAVVHISGALNQSHPYKGQQSSSLLHLSASNISCPLLGNDCLAGSAQETQYQAVPFSSPSGAQWCMFMGGDEEKLVIGGNGGPALHIQADLMTGHTKHCGMFESPPLCKGLFRIQALEVWGLDNSKEY